MYLIKKTYEATPKNTNFFPNTHIYLQGKMSSECISNEGTEYRWARVEPEEKAKVWLEDGSYKTKNGKAMMSAKDIADWENARGNWKVTVEWVEI